MSVDKLGIAKYLALQAADKLVMNKTLTDSQLKIVATWLDIAHESVMSELEERKGKRDLPPVNSRRGKIVKINEEATIPRRAKR